MYQSTKEGISIFAFWKEIDYPEDLEIKDYEISVFHKNTRRFYPSEVFNCLERIPPYKSTDKFELWYHGDDYTAWLIEFEKPMKDEQNVESYIRRYGNCWGGYSIITYKRLEDYLHIRKLQADGLIRLDNCRIVRETELWAYCFDASIEDTIEIDAQDSYCIFNTGGKVIAIIETGGLTHNVHEEDLGHIEVINIKNYNMYPLLVRGATNLFKSIHKAYDAVLLPTFPFTISLYVWEGDKMRDRYTIAENKTRPFKASETIHINKYKIEVRIDNYRCMLSLEDYFGYIPNVIELTVQDDLKEMSFHITDLEKHIEKKIPFPDFVKAV